MILQNRKLQNIADTDIFQRLYTAVSQYDYSDPLIDSIFPQNNKDSYVIQVIRNDLARTYWKWTYDQELRYTKETIHLIDLAEELAFYLQGTFPNTRWFKGHYICLLPHGAQNLHIDAPWWQKYAHRIVVPITTNPNAFTQCGHEQINMPAGQLYELNTQVIHGSSNNGTEIRTHLFLDYIPNNHWDSVQNFYTKQGRFEHTKSIIFESTDL